jgi:hypothetical protein
MRVATLHTCCHHKADESRTAQIRNSTCALERFNAYFSREKEVDATDRENEDRGGDKGKGKKVSQERNVAKREKEKIKDRT